MRCVGDNRRTWISESGKPLRLSVYINRRDSLICQFIILTTFCFLSLSTFLLTKWHFRRPTCFSHAFFSSIFSRRRYEAPLSTFNRALSTFYFAGEPIVVRASTSKFSSLPSIARVVQTKFVEFGGRASFIGRLRSASSSSVY